MQRTTIIAITFMLLCGTFATAASVEAKAEQKTADRPKLVFNIDFGVMLRMKPNGKPFVGSPKGYYEEADLRGLIHRAAESGFERVYFRISDLGRATCRSKVKEAPTNHSGWAETMRRYDPFKVAIEAAREAGIECYAWVTPFDDCGKKEGPKDQLAIGQSRFSHEHPEYQLLSRDGKDVLWGVYCFGHREVRDYWLRHVDELLEYNPDGIFFSNRTHSNMRKKQVEYGFNPPVVKRYKERFGGDPRDRKAYDLKQFSQIQGEFYTEFLREVSKHVHAKGKRFAAAVSWQRNGKIAPRLGALDKSFFDWTTWCNEQIVDELVIGGDLATGHNPEHILPNYEIKADSANPEFFKAKMKQPVPVYRWVTLWGWAWKKKGDVVGGVFTAPVVSKMLEKTVGTGLDGLVVHEAGCIARVEQWDTYQRFSGKDKEKQK